MNKITPTEFTEAIAQSVWDSKYRYRHGDHVIDQSIEDTWRRVAKKIASAEKMSEQVHWAQEFYGILKEFKFLPGGRILAGAGTEHQVTLLNCFVMKIADDSLRSIFLALEEGALTLQQGGGVGYDFSILRPHGDLVQKTGIAASGPISFMRIWDATCSVLLSTGARRGAMMGVLRCDHPDIESFISAKRDPQELRNFNVSVLVSDEFMQAVRDNAEWPLVFPCDNPSSEDEIIHKRWSNSQSAVMCKVYKRIKARKLWDTIIQSAYDYAEPGVLFHDTINKNNTLNYCEYIDATNPCGEIPLPHYGACDLGAINLTQFVIAPFSKEAAVNWEDIDKTVKVATRFLDNVLDVSNYPLPIQQAEAHAKRRIGLGITGLANAMVMLNVVYGSRQSIELAEKMMQRIAHVTWETSIELAKEKGSFSAFTEAYLQTDFVKRLPDAIQNDIKKYGMRNSHHNTIAPTGTISLLANNISNGIEPIFYSEYNRNVRLQDGTAEKFFISDYAFHAWKIYAATHNISEKYPPAWIDTNTLTPLAHIEIQAAVQPYIDNAISKTINLPHKFPYKSVAEIYTQAYELGLKGCTIYRPNEIRGHVLEIPEEKCCQLDESN